MKLLSCLMAASLLAGPRAGAEDKWTVHEWGTFTSLQDESGTTLGGINTDDEPVPAFVHRLDQFVLLRASEVPGVFFQGAPSCHPDITMRLETPVLYFHPAPNAPGIQTASAHVKFRGGWLSEYYPSAALAVPGLENGNFHFGRLNADTESKLAWNDLQVGGDRQLTNTTEHCWLCPRAVKAAAVQTADGESEKFLFYRGVAHIDAPLKVSRDPQSRELLFQSQLAGLPATEPLAIGSLWLVDIRPQGPLAFRALPPLSLGPDSQKYLLRTPADFAPGDFSRANLAQLKAQLKAALMAAGLFADEADALLNTWEVSYFKSPGLRVFFLVPRTWTDFYLPLEISPPSDLRRVMVGRIELVTPRQRDLLDEISHFSTNEIQQEAVQLLQNYMRRALPALAATPHAPVQRQLNRELALVNSGQASLAAFVPVPKTYQTYLNLGRFRNALLLDEASHHPTDALARFILTYRLQPYQTAAD